MTGASVRPPTMSVLLILLLIPVMAGSTSTTDACPLDKYEPVPDGLRLEDDILLAGRSERRYLPSQYRRRTDGPGYEVCSCAHKPCVIKCCKPGKVFENNKCVKSNQTHEKFAVPKFVTVNGPVEVYETDGFQIEYSKMKCINNTQIYQLKPSSTSNTDDFGVSEDGWLLNHLKSKYVAPGQFCLERFTENQFQIVAIVCDILPSETEETGLRINYLVALIVSLPFLLVTFLVYALIRKLRNLHGKSLMCHVATLLVAYTGLIIIQFISNQIENNVCIIIGLIIQFSFLASFFWLNVMCFDLWWTFSGFRPLKGNLRQHETKKFKIYSIYAWGCTSVISILTYSMQTFYSSSPFSPGLGEESCWFNSDWKIFIYFYFPIAVLLSSDILMFVYTAVMIAKKIRDTKIINHPDCKRKIDHDKQRFMLYLKLFIVMGINWMAEILSWTFENNDNGFNVWNITDYGNALQGVLIFLIFVCKKRVLRLLREKLCPHVKLFKKSTLSSTRTHFSSTISKTTTVS